MNKIDLGAIEHIIDEIVEKRVKKQMREFTDGIMKQYPNLPYDLRKAAVAVQDSAFDIFMNPPTTEDYGYNMWNNGLPKHSYLSPYTDIKLSATGAFAEATKFQMTQEDYDEGKKHSDVPVSAFDGLTAYETKYDLSPFTKHPVGPVSDEERARIPAFILGTVTNFVTPVKEADACVPGKAWTDTDTLMLSTQAEHHDKVLASVIHLSKG